MTGPCCSCYSPKTHAHHSGTKDGTAPAHLPEQTTRVMTQSRSHNLWCESTHFWIKQMNNQPLCLRWRAALTHGTLERWALDWTIGPRWCRVTHQYRSAPASHCANCPINVHSLHPFWWRRKDGAVITPVLDRGLDIQVHSHTTDTPGRSGRLRVKSSCPHVQRTWVQPEVCFQCSGHKRMQGGDAMGLVGINGLSTERDGTHFQFPTSFVRFFSTDIQGRI